MITSPFSLEGRNVLVTGASSGLGRQTAIVLSKMGARVVVTARNQARLEETLNQLEAGEHQMIIADLSGPDSLVDLVKQIKNPLDGLVHCAGISKTLPFKFTGHAVLREVFEINVEVPFLLTQHLVKKKMLNNGASVVFLSSVYGTGVVAPGVSAYAMSKGALISGAKVLALELAAKKIRVNCICPGKVKTELLLSDPNITAEDLERDEKNYLLGFGETYDVAYGIVYLLSDAARWVTGGELLIDGGLSVL